MEKHSTIFARCCTLYTQQRSEFRNTNHIANVHVRQSTELQKQYIWITDPNPRWAGSVQAAAYRHKTTYTENWRLAQTCEEPKKGPGLLSPVIDNSSIRETTQKSTMFSRISTYVNLTIFQTNWSELLVWWLKETCACCHRHELVELMVVAT